MRRVRARRAVKCVCLTSQARVIRRGAYVAESVLRRARVSGRRIARSVLQG